MATNKKKQSEELETPGDLESPGEFTIADTVDDTPAAPAPLKYVGPPYHSGIQIGGTRETIRPADFSPEQIAAFLEKHPNRRHWWQ